MIEFFENQEWYFNEDTLTYTPVATLEGYSWNQIPTPDVSKFIKNSCFVGFNLALFLLSSPVFAKDFIKTKKDVFIKGKCNIDTGIIQKPELIFPFGKSRGTLRQMKQAADLKLFFSYVFPYLNILFSNINSSKLNREPLDSFKFLHFFKEIDSVMSNTQPHFISPSKIMKYDVPLFNQLILQLLAQKVFLFVFPYVVIKVFSSSFRKSKNFLVRRQTIIKRLFGLITFACLGAELYFQADADLMEAFQKFFFDQDRLLIVSLLSNEKALEKSLSDFRSKYFYFYYVYRSLLRLCNPGEFYLYIFLISLALLFPFFGSLMYRRFLISQKVIDPSANNTANNNSQ